MKTNPLVSVVIPCFNGERFIKETVDSVSKHTYTNIELIIINDGSNDQNLQVLEQLTDQRIRVLNKENTGVSDTRNKGLFLSEGEFIIFLDADDLIEETFIEKAIDQLLKNKRIDFITTTILNIDEKSKPIEKTQEIRGTYKNIKIKYFTPLLSA